MKLLFTEKALHDLTRLREFIAQHDPQAAARVSESLQIVILKLTRFPNIGRPIRRAPEPEKLRELIAGKYVVRYLISEKAVCILRVWHEKEDRKDG